MLLNFRRSQLSDKNAYLHFVYEEYAKKNTKNAVSFGVKRVFQGGFGKRLPPPNWQWANA